MPSRDEVVEVMARAMFKTQPRVDKKKDYWAEYPDDDEEKQVYRNDARVALSALNAAGWAVVPREATGDMLDVVTRRFPKVRGAFMAIWRAMLSAGEVE